MMSSSFRRVVVVTMALLFAASSFAARYCMAAHFSPGHTIVAESAKTDGTQHSHSSGHEEHAQHDHGASHHQQSPSDKSDATCAKCCGTCTLTTAVMPSAAMPAFAVASIVFASKSKDCSETTVRVDPGIPKRIA